MTKPKLLFATTNDHKIRLFDIAIADFPDLLDNFELITLKDLEPYPDGDIAEDSGSFAGDALLKAKAYANYYGLATISQDRGFIFDALNWPGTDTKKVFTGNDSHQFKKGVWSSTKDKFFQRAGEILAKIDGLDRSMTVFHALAASLPDGRYMTQELTTKGKASDEPRESLSGAGGMYDWFFIPDGYDHTVAEFTTQEACDNFQARSLYPITGGIKEFIKKPQLFSST
jgi:XTP/dITP diphosphohydrolase